MIKNKLLYLVLALLFSSADFSAQRVEKIKFKKDASLYFFQKGAKSDTLKRNRDNLFYLLVPDTLKKHLSIAVENAQLLSTSNDSLVVLKYLPGFQYETFYAPKETTSVKKSRPVYELKTLINGVSILPQNKISISLIDKSTGGLLLENVFVYSE